MLVNRATQIYLQMASCEATYVTDLFSEAQVGHIVQGQRQNQLNYHMLTNLGCTLWGTKK